MADTEIKIQRKSPSQTAQYFKLLEAKIKSSHSLVAVRYINLGAGILKVMIYDGRLLSHLEKQLTFSLLEQSAAFDATIHFWHTSAEEFDSKERVYLMDEQGDQSMPAAFIDGKNSWISGYDRTSRTYFYGTPCTTSDELANEGHIFFRQFYQFLKYTPSASLVHGACVGVNGKGALICARGNMGKSTLTVLSLLRGFEYVSDDYLVLHKEGSALMADPIYSIITLSPQMYEKMKEDLDGVSFVSDNWNRSKYILNISNLHGSFRRNYPVKVCIFPEIREDCECGIQPCPPLEKGKAITHMVHSTISQAGDYAGRENIIKISGMLRNMDFYHMVLSPDIEKNVECLRDFLNRL